MSMWSTIHVSSQLYLEVYFFRAWRPFDLGNTQLFLLSENAEKPSNPKKFLPAPEKDAGGYMKHVQPETQVILGI